MIQRGHQESTYAHTLCIIVNNTCLSQCVEKSIQYSRMVTIHSGRKAETLIATSSRLFLLIDPFIPVIHRSSVSYCSTSRPSVVHTYMYSQTSGPPYPLAPDNMPATPSGWEKAGRGTQRLPANRWMSRHSNGSTKHETWLKRRLDLGTCTPMGDGKESGCQRVEGRMG